MVEKKIKKPTDMRDVKSEAGMMVAALNDASNPFFNENRREENFSDALREAIDYPEAAKAQLETVQKNEVQYENAQKILKTVDNLDKMDESLVSIRSVWEDEEKRNLKVEEVANLAAESPEMWVPFLRACLESRAGWNQVTGEKESDKGLNRGYSAVLVLEAMMDKGLLTEKKETITAEIKSFHFEQSNIYKRM